MRDFDDIRRGDHVYRDGRFYQVLRVPSPLEDDAKVTLGRIPLNARTVGERVEWPLIDLQRAGYAGRAALIPGPDWRAPVRAASSRPLGTGDRATAA